MPSRLSPHLVRCLLLGAVVAPMAAAFPVAAQMNTPLSVEQAASATLPTPQGRAVLSVNGNIAVTNIGGDAVFDIESLAAIGTKEVTTATPWTDGSVTFTGVPFSALMRSVGAEGHRVRITALNDYSAETDIAVLTEAGAILAFAADGVRLSVRDKGPLWVIFPFDADADLRTDAYWGVSVWQVATITVE